MHRIAFTAALTLAATAVCAQDGPLPPPETILRWTPAQQLVGYRNMEKIYPVAVVRRGPEVRPLPLAPRQIAPQVTFQSRTYEIADYMAAYDISGVLALKDGEIVLERYGLGRAAEDRWTSFSVAKSVTSTLVGAAIRDGKIGSLADPVTAYIPELIGSAYDGVTVGHLLTMTSGVKWNEDYSDPRSDVANAGVAILEPGVNPIVSYMRRLPRESAPGTTFVYKTSETDLAGILVSNAVGKPIGEYLSETIWAPYGMERDAVWMLDPGGHERGGCCMSLTLRDYARFALFITQGGRINGRAVLPDGWTREATSALVDAGDGEGYGYFWWSWPDGSYGAIGIFGQAVVVYPEERLIIAINSAWPQAGGAELNAMRQALIESIRTATR